MNGFLQPVNGSGFAAFTQAAEAAGWYQFNTPRRNALLPAITGITIPTDAQGFMIQAKTSLDYMFSPSSALLGATGSFNLPAGGYAFFSGADSLAAFCMLMPAAGAQFVVTFYSGSIGPIPMLNIPDTGGVVPPPPPGGAALFTINTLWVMKNTGGNGGNDATGTRNRMDLPFLTIAAAEAAAVAGDTICVLPGNYTEPTLGVNGLTYIGFGANITCASGPAFLADGISFEVRGFDTLTGSDASAYVLKADSSGLIIAQCTTITGSGGGCHCLSDAEMVVVADINTIATHAALCEDGRQTITGSLFSRDSNGAHTNNEFAIQVINGDVSSLLERGAYCAAGSQTINGDASSDTLAGAFCSDGTQAINGTASGIASYGAWCNGATAVQVISEDATSDADYGAVCDSGAQTIGRDAIVTATGSGNAAYCGATGVQHIMRNAINLGAGAATSTTSAGALQYVHGEARNVSGACCRSTGGYTKVFGDAYSETERAVLAQGGTVEIGGTAIADADVAVDIDSAGTCILWGGATTNAAATAAIKLTDATDTLILRGAAYVRNDGTGNAIDNPLGTGGVVTSYGAYGSAPVDGTLTLNGTFTVLP